MLFTVEEKNMLIGAFSAGIVDTALESYYNYRDGQGYNIRAHPEDPIYWLYYNFPQAGGWIPPADDLIALVGVPFLLYGIAKKKRSAKLKQMSLGAMVYGFSEIIGWTALKAARYAAGKPVYKLYAQGGRS